MVNQQLIDYVKQQLQGGVSKEVLRGTLLQAGWPDADVTEVLQDKPVAPVVQPVQVAAQPMPLTQKPSAPAMSFSAPAMKSVAASSMNPTSTTSTPATFGASNNSSPAIMTSDVFKAAKNEPVFQPKVEVAAASPKTENFSASPLRRDISGSAAMTTPQQPVASMSQATHFEEKPSRGSTWSVIIMGLITLVLVGISGFLYKNTSDLDLRVRELTADKASLNGQISSVQSASNDANAKAAALDAELKEANVQLGLFVLPKGTSTEPFIVSLKGSIGGGADKAAYTLTTSKNIVISLKNGKDPKTEAVIKPLIGSSVEIAGTYVANSREVTVTAVNGTPL